MALDPNEVQKPLSKLRKLLKKMPKQPTPDQVHDLRTNSESRSLTGHINEITKQKEMAALEVANRLRNHYFSENRKNARQSRKQGMPQPALMSAARLAEPE